MRESVHALIVAAGEGRRAGVIGGMKKQFAPIGGCPVVIHTLTAFQTAPCIDTIVCVIAREDRDAFSDLIRSYPLPKVKAVVDGGDSRQASVAAGLLCLQKTCALEDIVMVHDGVRPLVSPLLIERVLKAARTYGGAAAAMPATDSLKIVSAERLIQQSLLRDAVWAMQTPQAFRLGLLLEAMRKAMAEGFIGTDEAALMERIGHPVFCVEGSPTNLKITTRSDLEYAEILLKKEER